MISIIIRTHNEERWIKTCLEGIQKQIVRSNIEVILVDNASSDLTVARAKTILPNLKVVNIRDYRPGMAINEGILSADGEFIVCLSAHCVPANPHWLENLYKNMADPNVAGVYGRQLPTPFTTAIDKRDLLLAFGPERKVQRMDCFFHNANSMIRRSIWERIPFDNTITHIEDRAWGKAVIESGNVLVYEPLARVYHYHGIHQANRSDRAENVARIITGLSGEEEILEGNPFHPGSMDISAIIPVRRRTHAVNIDLDDRMVMEAIQCAKKCKHIKRIIISTDSEELADKCKSWGAEAPFIRPPDLSALNIRIDDVLRYSLDCLEGAGYYPDIVLPLELTYPFRTPELLDGVIEQLLRDGHDTVIAGYVEHRPCWIREDKTLTSVTHFSDRRNERNSVCVGLIGLACATYPQSVRRGSRLGTNIGIYEVKDPFSIIEIRDIETLKHLKARRAEYALGEREYA